MQTFNVELTREELQLIRDTMLAKLRRTKGPCRTLGLLVDSLDWHLEREMWQQASEKLTALKADWSASQQSQKA